MLADRDAVLNIITAAGFRAWTVRIMLHHIRFVLFEYRQQQ